MIPTARMAGGAAGSAVQDPLQRLGPPELPGSVGPLPVDSWVWILMLAAVAILVWVVASRWAAWAASRRGLQVGSALDSLERTLSADHLAFLHARLEDLSEEQQAEARALSQLVRWECGRRLGADQDSATEEQLLRRLSVTDPDAPKDEAQRILVGTLSFVRGILFAGIRPSAGVWRAQLREIERWLEQEVEPAEEDGP